MRPLSDCPRERLAGIKAVLTDIDDTLTNEGRLPAMAYAALEELQAAGFKVVPVTGRPAGWCDLIARQWPVDGVVGENGAFYFRYDDEAKRMSRVYAQAKATREANQQKLFDIARQVLAEFPGTAMASDQAYREIDVAIDFCEDVPALPLSTAQAIAARFQAAGCIAKVSSIHVNAWIGAHDKLTSSLKMLADVFEIESKNAASRVAYCGDSPNDEPMFAYFENSFGVANVAPFLPLMKAKPRFGAERDGGHGFAEIAKVLIGARGAAK
jgi:hypothetical protein